MTTTSTESIASPPRSSGRGLFWMGIGLCVLAVALVVGQFALKVLMVPWYVPIMTTLGAVLLMGSIIRRRSITRIVGFALIAALAALQWFCFVSFTKLPDYQGTAKVGQQIPGFQTTLADGSTFTEKSLQDGTPTVMVFFRGRW